MIEQFVDQTVVRLHYCGLQRFHAGSSTGAGIVWPDDRVGQEGTSGNQFVVQVFVNVRDPGQAIRRVVKLSYERCRAVAVALQKLRCVLQAHELFVQLRHGVQLELGYRVQYVARCCGHICNSYALYLKAMTPDLIRRTRSPVDTEDLALQFVEDELGRFDFRVNWAKVKEKGDVRQRIQQWLEALNADGNPDEIIEYLDRLVTDRAGNWR